MADSTPNTKLQYSDEKIEELTDVENDPKAMGDAEDIRGLLFEEAESKITHAKEELEVASDRLSEVMKAVEDLDGEHEELRGKVMDTFDSLEEGQMAVDEAKEKCGRRFESLTLEDRLSMWAACHSRFPQLVEMVDKQRNALLVANKQVGGLQEKNEALKEQRDDALDELSRLQSETEALDLLL